MDKKQIVCQVSKSAMCVQEKARWPEWLELNEEGEEGREVRVEPGDKR
jgi:hypothetical protein